MTPRPACALILAAAVTLPWQSGIAMAAESATYAGFDQGVFLRFLNAPADDAEITSPPHLRIAFGGKPRIATMDTGSTGVVVAASAIPGVDQLPGTPGKITYTSSGRVMVGNWVTVPMTIAGRDGNTVTTRPLPVLAVTRIDCLPTARSCTPVADPRGVSMLGVGFGRQSDDQAEGTPEKNPLLAVAPLEPSKPYRRGYVVTRTGVMVGLTAAVDREPYDFVKLAANPAAPGDWLPAPVCISVNGKSPPACGASLVDTGVAGMFLTLPPDQVAGSTAENDNGSPTLAEGTKLTLAFGPGGASKPAEAYGFTVGEMNDPLEPEFIDLNTTRPQPFVNTSVHFLNGFDYLYDADGGFVAYRRAGVGE